MATAAAVSSGGSPATITDEERRWVVVGVCLTKVLTPALRDVLRKTMPDWHKTLLGSPHDIDKQTFRKHMKNPPHSKFKFNYESINNNFTNHKSSYRNYDYCVKDPISLGKLFMKPFMASFTGFDQTMDTSAALSVVAEAQPFHAASGTAKTIRSDVRNEWAHCNFSHWSDVNYQAALDEIEILLNNINLTVAEKKKALDDLDGWKQKGLDLCFGQLVDSELLKLVRSEVGALRESVKLWKKDAENNQDKALNVLETIEKSLNGEIEDLKKRQLRTEHDVEQLKEQHLALSKTINARKNKDEPRPLFMAPKKIEWFSGRQPELDLLRNILVSNCAGDDKNVTIAAVSGLGGSGKTSLTAEYIHNWKTYYEGGVYWFSGENDVKLKVSLDDIAAQFDTLHDNSPEATLAKTLAVFSRITKPWLIVVDDMDESSLSRNLLKLVSGSWQENVSCFGHLIITTRRTSQEIKHQIRSFEESRCLKLECFNPEEAKNFIFKRTGICHNEEQESIADLLFQKLGGLPLALEQACAYIKKLDCTLSEYMELYEKQSLQLLNKEKATLLYEGTSPERLAVRTTWLLNFEYIRKNENGMVAVRFLNASVFMNPNEIQKELINVGEPRIDDKAYCDHLSSSLGSLEVLKLLTDFSLFKETHSSSLAVHRLVQEVIRENLKPQEKVESIVDASRLLRFAFSNYPSPDELLQDSVGREHNDRSSLHSIDFSRFHKWYKLCLHAYEIKNNLEGFLDVVNTVKEKNVFLPEVARIVYECALYLNVNNYCSQAKAVADFANRILDLGGNVVSEDLLPHMLPLSESLRRFIHYSCKAPLDRSNSNASNTSVNASIISEIEITRLEGNELFKDGNFQEALNRYTSCIDKNKETDSFDPTLLSNRASAYLRLNQYSKALKDAEAYIKYRPKCWKGHARKALAIHGLDKKSWHAMCAAALAFYFNRKIFDDFKPFKISFSNLKQIVFVCDDVSSFSFSLSPSPCNIGLPSKIVVLKPGKYCLSAEGVDGVEVVEDNLFNVKRLWLKNIALIGVSDSSPVTLSFTGNFGLQCLNFMAVNISFVFDLGNVVANHCSLLECSVTGNHDRISYLSQNDLSVENCHFSNCKGEALYVRGSAVVKDSVFSGNSSVGLKVVGPGNVVIENNKLYGNQWGLDVMSATCDVTGCQIYDNKKIGVGVSDGKVKLERNEIFHNDRHGIYLCEKSFAVIKKNDIFENGFWGIETMTDACCHVSHNKIYKNKCGGVHALPIESDQDKMSVIEFNQIIGNEGPGIDESYALEDKVGAPLNFRNIGKAYKTATCTGNLLKDNICNGMAPPSHNVTEICFYCHKHDQLKKCTKCFVAEYCNSDCQKRDGKTHKKNCARLLEKHSVVVKVLPLSSGVIGDKVVVGPLEKKAPFEWMEPSGSKYAGAPKMDERFIVKIQACDTKRRSNEGGTLFSIEDRSLKINGSLDKNEHSRLYHLVRNCGSNCESYGWKKKFFWALLTTESSMVRVFISDFPTYERW